ncbi:dTMP kinase [Candidatus Micrarchaeota archaeon RBG_16_49_10]|nr:MAG: dTMP kinase [Candidatus Micrarchaeota archaeon RBG_16_49_10]
MKRGMFIVFEGPDGAGSSTQTRLLADWFLRDGLQAVATKNPTNNIIGGIIRTILKRELEVDMKTFALLFSADRAHHLHKEVEPLLADGFNVVCDRYILSTLAFQSTEEDIIWLKQLNSKFRRPDFTFILDVPAKICVARIRKSRPGFEFFETEKRLAEVIINYRKLTGYFLNTFLVKGYGRSPQAINQQVVETIRKHSKNL